MSAFGVLVCHPQDADALIGRVRQSGTWLECALMGKRSEWRAAPFHACPAFGGGRLRPYCLGIEPQWLRLAGTGHSDDDRKLTKIRDRKLAKKRREFASRGWTADRIERWEQQQRVNHSQPERQAHTLRTELLLFDLAQVYQIGFGWYWLETSLARWTGLIGEQAIAAPLLTYRQSLLYLPRPI